MGRLGVHEFITVDGIIEDPSWTAAYPFDPNMGEAIAALTDPDGAILLGRRTYEMFYPAWSTRTTDDDPGAPFFNETEKFVVTSTLKTAEWSNSTILGPYDRSAIQSLKDRIGGRIYVSGSAALVRALLSDGLVDELHLFVFPLTLGSGLRLFPDGYPETRLALLDIEAYDSQVVHLTYGPGE